jgi:hypothetical protein
MVNYNTRSLYSFDIPSQFTEYVFVKGNCDFWLPQISSSQNGQKLTFRKYLNNESIIFHISNNILGNANLNIIIPTGSITGQSTYETNSYTTTIVFLMMDGYYYQINENLDKITTDINSSLTVLNTNVTNLQNGINSIGTISTDNQTLTYPYNNIYLVSGSVRKINLYPPCSVDGVVIKFKIDITDVTTKIYNELPSVVNGLLFVSCDTSLLTLNNLSYPNSVFYVNSSTLTNYCYGLNHFYIEFVSKDGKFYYLSA